MNWMKLETDLMPPVVDGGLGHSMKSGFDEDVGDGLAELHDENIEVITLFRWYLRY